MFDFLERSSGLPPVPQSKPQQVSGGTSILDSIFNTATNVFETLGGLELQKHIARQMADIREEEERGRTQKQEVFAGTVEPYQAGFSTTGFIAVGMIAVAGLLILRSR